MPSKAKLGESSQHETVHTADTLDKTTRPAPIVHPGFTLKHRALPLSQSTEHHEAIALRESSARLETVSMPGRIAQPRITLKQRAIVMEEDVLPLEVILQPEPLQRPKKARKFSLRSIIAAGITLMLVVASIGSYLLVGTNSQQNLPWTQIGPIQFNTQPHDAQNGLQPGGTPVTVQGRVAREQQQQGGKVPQGGKIPQGKVPQEKVPQGGTTGNTTKNTQPNAPGGGISPYIFGTNLGLFDTGDQFLNSAVTRNMMQQMHVRMIRMPVRSNLSMNTEIQAAQAIKSIGAAPLVILRGLRNPNFVAENIAIVQAMNQVFGKSPVYYEFSNEDDLAGIGVNEYLNAWNIAIPKVKPLALNAVFIGPVNYQYDRDYLSAFLQKANPKPDMISWHEYTCSYKWAADVCLSHIDNWTNHINDARSTMQSTIGQTLPLLITEWNYCPDQLLQGNGQPFSDGKYNNTAFITAWTAKALQTLAANRVFASMHYSATNTALPIVSPDGTITPQGMAFQAAYQQIIG